MEKKTECVKAEIVLTDIPNGRLVSKPIAITPIIPSWYAKKNPTVIFLNIRNFLENLR